MVFILDDNDEANGYVMSGVASFSLFFARLSFFFRIILIATILRVSNDFVAIIKGKNANAPHVDTLDDRVNRIYELHLERAPQFK